MEEIDLTKRESDENTMLVSKELGDKRKKIWQEQNKGLQINIGDCVKLAITDTNGTEHLWFEVTKVNPFIGRCDNAPIVVKKVKFNDIVPFKFEEIEDYVKKSYYKVNSNELAKLKAKQLVLNRLEEEEEIKKMRENCYLDFMLPPQAFDFNDEKSWKLLFEPENLAWHSKKTGKIIQPHEIGITRDRVIDKLSFLYANCAFWILYNYGDSSYKKVARYLHFSEELINETISIWKKEQKEVKKHESNNPNSV